jgi:putative glutamine amidotransferase
MRLVSGYYDDIYPFNHMNVFTDTGYAFEADELKRGDALIIWGGEDISPTLYNKEVSRFSGSGPQISTRDAVEWSLMKRAVELEIPIIGVCRGAQMLCALAGGHLLQHVDNHGGTHVVETPTGYEFVTNSIHHQMMYPFNVEHEMLASIKTPRSKYHFDVNESVPVPEEPEFVYFPKVKGFAVQWHPEAMDADCPATKYIFDQIEARL